MTFDETKESLIGKVFNVNGDIPKPNGSLDYGQFYFFVDVEGTLYYTKQAGYTPEHNIVWTKIAEKDKWSAIKTDRGISIVWSSKPSHYLSEAFNTHDLDFN